MVPAAPLVRNNEAFSGFSFGAVAFLTSLSGALSHHEGADSVHRQAEQLLGLQPLHPLKQPAGGAQEKRITLKLSAGKGLEVWQYPPMVDLGSVAGGYVVLLPRLDGADSPPVALSVHQKEESF